MVKNTKKPFLSKYTKTTLSISIVFLFIFTSTINPLLAETTPSHTIKKIALTFDDGPYGTSTEEILKTLEENKIPATFFVIGKRAEQYPQLIKRMAADGFDIGSHSYDHSSKLKNLSYQSFLNDLQKTEVAIKKAGGPDPKYFRPPYGLISNTMRKVLTDNNYTNILWNIDAKDWDKKVSSDALVKTVLKKVDQGQKNIKTNTKDKTSFYVLLLHDGRDTHNNYPRENIVKALPEIIHILQKEGFVFTTLDQIL